MNDIPVEMKNKVTEILGKFRDCEIAKIQLCECYIRFTTCKGKKFELDIEFINSFLDLYNYERIE